MEITLIRHGQSQANVSGRWQGQGDSALTEHGAAQARFLGERLFGAQVDALIASDLTRARETARALGREPLLEAQWREINVGAWEGLTRDEVTIQFPQEAARLATGATDVPVGGGESWDDVRKRASAALEQLRGTHEGRRVWVVTHGGLITALTSSLLGISMQMPRRLGKIINTAMTTLQLSGEGAQLVRFNDTQHLDEGTSAALNNEHVWLHASDSSSLGMPPSTHDVASLVEWAQQAPETGIQLQPAELRALLAKTLGCDQARVALPNPGTKALLRLDDAVPRLGRLIPVAAE